MNEDYEALRKEFEKEHYKTLEQLKNATQIKFKSGHAKDEDGEYLEQSLIVAPIDLVLKGTHHGDD